MKKMEERSANRSEDRRVQKKKREAKRCKRRERPKRAEGEGKSVTKQRKADRAYTWKRTDRRLEQQGATGAN